MVKNISDLLLHFELRLQLGLVCLLSKLNIYKQCSVFVQHICGKTDSFICLFALEKEMEKD